MRLIFRPKLGVFQYLIAEVLTKKINRDKFAICPGF